jgi:hypothetical protein
MHGNVGNPESAFRDILSSVTIPAFNSMQCTEVVRFQPTRLIWVFLHVISNMANLGALPCDFQNG